MTTLHIPLDEQGVPQPSPGVVWFPPHWTRREGRPVAPVEIAQGLLGRTSWSAGHAEGWAMDVHPGDTVGKLYVADYEDIWSAAHWPTIREHLLGLRRAMPGVRLALYPACPVPSSLVPPEAMDQREDLIRRRYLPGRWNNPASWAMQSWYIGRAVAHLREVVDLVDVYSPDCYVLSRADLDRDLDWIRVHAAIARRLRRPFRPFISGWAYMANEPLGEAEAIRLRAVLDDVGAEGAINWNSTVSEAFTAALGEEE